MEFLTFLEELITRRLRLGGFLIRARGNGVLLYQPSGALGRGSMARGSINFDMHGHIGVLCQDQARIEAQRENAAQETGGEKSGRGAFRSYSPQKE